MSRCQFLVGDAFAHMANIPDQSVDLIVTSPPFLALRSYLPAGHPDKDKEIGSEATPAVYLSTLLALTREWRRILAPHGSICIELGDTYSGSGGSGGDYNEDGLRAGQPKVRTFRQSPDQRASSVPVPGWPLAKSLCLIPSLYAASLAYGHNLLNPADRIDPWRVRNVIVWHRPNPPVGALGDKVRPSTSYITVACTSDKRWFDLDAERTPYTEGTLRQYKNGPTASQANNPASKGMTEQRLTHEGAPPLDCWIDGDDWTAPPDEPPRGNPNTHRRTGKGVNAVERTGKSSDRGGNWATLPELGETQAAPPLDAWFGDDLGTASDVWTLPTAPYKGAHYATYPPALPRRLINLMCPRQVCTQCEEPRRRIVETVRPITDDSTRRKNANGERPGPNRMDRPPEIGWELDRTTLGWSDCGHDTWRRGQVCDPFAGSGTTGQAAVEQGRDSILIDLDERSVDLARQRIGLFLEEGVST